MTGAAFDMPDATAISPLRTRPHFDAPEAFASAEGYEILPFRYARIPNLPGQILLTSPVGEYLFVNEADLAKLTRHELSTRSDVYRKLRARQLVCDRERGPLLEGLAAQRRTQKLFSAHDPALHIFVVTLRCDHRCPYCQVSPRRPGETGFEMSALTAEAALDRVFESETPSLTIEFQGGEAGLAFDRVRHIVENAEKRQRASGQSLRFVIATTLHLLDDDILAYCRDHRIELSTSLDGPAHVHNANRINSTRDSFARTVAGIERARRTCGDDSVDALATITRHSLPYARQIIDTYVELGFRSISLRPLSPFGFAVRSAGRIGYATADYLDFYREALDYLIALNLAGTRIEETYATLLLTKILTPFPTGYVDLQSPAAAGRGVLVYNYDGGVYVSDEARMLSAMGDDRFRMGTVFEPLSALQSSAAMKIVAGAGDAEQLPGCKDCAFVPYCGADPVFHAATQNDPVGHRPTSEFCHRHTGLFQLMFEHLARRDPSTMRVFLSWLRRKSFAEIPHAGYWG
jgi:His-Xaa-Ser system radical SAM maturase HxsB